MQQAQDTPQDTAPANAHDTLLALFAERARAVGAWVSMVPSPREAAHIIAVAEVPSTTGRYTATRQLTERYPTLGEEFRAFGVELRVVEELQSDGTPPDVAAAIAGDVGLVLGQWGVAETGSFLSMEETLAGRLLGMLGDTVFAFLPASNVVATLDDIGETLSDLVGQGRRYMSLVTGPSRTADIERVLTIGVHGPRALTIVVIGEAGP